MYKKINLKLSNYKSDKNKRKNQQNLNKMHSLVAQQSDRKIVIFIT